MALAYGSVCSGIESATVAWHPLGWRPQFFSEIEAAPRAVLTHRWPEVPLHGDFTTIREGEYGSIDLLVGGTPCQDFSVAGLRGGLAGERGNLSLEFLRLAHRLRPRWLVWENVPGVLSSNGGRDFGAILGGMVELGYGFAYRVLDAQYVRIDGFGRAVPQRRRRVFVVGHLGDWRRPAAVLFERACLRGDPAPRREAGAGTAVDALAGTSPGGGWRVGADEAAAGQLVAEPAGLQLRRLRGDERSDMVADVRMVRSRAHGGDTAGAHLIAAPFAPAISASNPYGDHESREGLLVAHSLRSEGFDASEDGSGRGTPIVPVAFGGGNTAGPIEVGTCLTNHASRSDFDTETFIAFDTTQITSALNRSAPQPGGPCHPLAAGAHPPAVAFNWQAGGDETTSLKAYPYSPTLTKNQTPALAQGWAVRRLTPLECERLQGFPDGYTAVPWRGGILADGPRYKALGNSKAVNVVRWIGRRIEMVEAISTASLMAAE